MIGSYTHQLAQNGLRALIVGSLLFGGGAAGDVSSGSEQDHVAITVREHARPELAQKGQYRLIFTSALQSQDRSLFESVHGSTLRAFKSRQVSMDINIGQDSTLLFRATYSSWFGTFVMNNGVDSWTVQHVNPGDEVEFRWGE